MSSSTSGVFSFPAPIAERQQNNAAFLTDLKAALPAEQLVLDSARLTNDYSSDRSFHTPVTPMAVALPKSPQEASAVIRLCNKHNITVHPRGAGTGLEGSCIPYLGGLVVDTSLLKRFDVDALNGHVWVGAGHHKMHVMKLLQKENLMFGPDPASNPSVGGMVATSGSGMSTLKYGTTRENLVSLLVVTASGDIIQTRKAVRKTSTGLDLTHLYCGSEGTLGLVVECCFKVYPLTTHRSGGLVTFPTSADAVSAVVAVKQLPALRTLVRLELLNTGGIIATNKAYKLTLEETPTLLIEMQDTYDASVYMGQEFENILRPIFEGYNCKKCDFIVDGKSFDDAWEARRGCLMAAVAYRGKKKTEKVLITDVCVPLSALATVITETEKDFESKGVVCIICAHIADGNFHCMVPFSTAEEKKEVLGLEHRLVRRAITAGGTASGEHGVGIGKVRHLVEEHGKAHICVQECIKAALDPKNLFNPGVFYPSQQTRYGTAHL